jgi:hypothetical protein
VHDLDAAIVDAVHSTPRMSENHKCR